MCGRIRRLAPPGDGDSRGRDVSRTSASASLSAYGYSSTLPFSVPPSLIVRAA